MCKRAVALTAEALECHGGNGYVEESILPRLYREAPLNSIWEGSGNVNALDALRAMSREPESLTAYLSEVQRARGADARLDGAVEKLTRELGDVGDSAGSARRLGERMCLALQGSLLVRHGDPAVAEAFCASRLAGEGGHAFGTLPPGLDLPAIIHRHQPLP